MELVLNIVFAGLILAGCYMALQYTYLAIWRLAREKEKEKQNQLSLHTFFYGFGATFAFLLSAIAKEPLAKVFLPHFFIFSIFMGITLRNSAMQPIRSAEILSKLLSQMENHTPEKEAENIHKD